MRHEWSYRDFYPIPRTRAIDVDDAIRMRIVEQGEWRRARWPISAPARRSCRGSMRALEATVDHVFVFVSEGFCIPTPQRRLGATSLAAP